MNNIEDLLIKHKDDGSRFAKPLSEFIAKQFIDAETVMVVETGTGISTLYLLKNVPNIRLWSIDAHPWFSDTIIHPNYTFINKYSDEALLQLYNEIGAWDVFLHDSDHDIKNMVYEFEFGLACVKDDGFLFSDDTSWNNHNAWQMFTSNYSLPDSALGSLRYIQKKNVGSISDYAQYDKFCKKVASEIEQDWLAAGNKNSDIHNQWEQLRYGK